MIREHYESRVKETAMDIKMRSHSVGFDLAVEEIRGDSTLPKTYFSRAVDVARDWCAPKRTYFGGLVQHFS